MAESVLGARMSPRETRAVATECRRRCSVTCGCSASWHNPENQCPNPLVVNRCRCSESAENTHGPNRAPAPRQSFDPRRGVIRRIRPVLVWPTTSSDVPRLIVSTRPSRSPNCSAASSPRRAPESAANRTSSRTCSARCRSAACRVQGPRPSAALRAARTSCSACPMSARTSSTGTCNRGRVHPERHPDLPHSGTPLPQRPRGAAPVAAAKAAIRGPSHGQTSSPVAVRPQRPASERPPRTRIGSAPDGPSVSCRAT
jgi:hypothetical protein